MVSAAAVDWARTVGDAWVNRMADVARASRDGSDRVAQAAVTWTNTVAPAETTFLKAESDAFRQFAQTEAAEFRTMTDRIAQAATAWIIGLLQAELTSVTAAIPLVEQAAKDEVTAWTTLLTDWADAVSDATVDVLDDVRAARLALVPLDNPVAIAVAQLLNAEAIAAAQEGLQGIQSLPLEAFSAGPVEAMAVPVNDFSALAAADADWLDAALLGPSTSDGLDHRLDLAGTDDTIALTAALAAVGAQPSSSSSRSLPLPPPAPNEYIFSHGARDRRGNLKMNWPAWLPPPDTRLGGFTAYDVVQFGCGGLAAVRAGSRNIYVHRTRRMGVKVFTSYDDAYDYLRSLRSQGRNVLLVAVQSDRPLRPLRDSSGRLLYRDFGSRTTQIDPRRVNLLGRSRNFATLIQTRGGFAWEYANWGIHSARKHRKPMKIFHSRILPSYACTVFCVVPDSLTSSPVVAPRELFRGDSRP